MKILNEIGLTAILKKIKNRLLPEENVGGELLPVYLKNGVLTACSSSLVSLTAPSTTINVDDILQSTTIIGQWEVKFTGTLPTPITEGADFIFINLYSPGETWEIILNSSSIYYRCNDDNNQSTDAWQAWQTVTHTAADTTTV